MTTALFWYALYIIVGNIIGLHAHSLYEGVLRITPEHSVLATTCKIMNRDGYIETSPCSVHISGEISVHKTKYPIELSLPGSEIIISTTDTFSGAPMVHINDVILHSENTNNEIALLIIPTYAIERVTTSGIYEFPIIVSFGNKNKEIAENIITAGVATTDVQTSIFTEKHNCIRANKLSRHIIHSQCSSEIVVSEHIIMSNSSGIYTVQNPLVQDKLNSDFVIVGWCDVFIFAIALLTQKTSPSNYVFRPTHGMFASICFCILAFIYKWTNFDDVNASIHATHNAHIAVFGADRGRQSNFEDRVYITTAVAAVFTTICILAEVPDLIQSFFITEDEEESETSDADVDIHNNEIKAMMDVTHQTEYIKRDCTSIMAAISTFIGCNAIVTSNPQSAGMQVVVFFIQITCSCQTVTASAAMIASIFQNKEILIHRNVASMSILLIVAMVSFGLSLAGSYFIVRSGLFSGIHIFLLEQGLSLSVADIIYYIIILFSYLVAAKKSHVIYRNVALYNKENA
jgi:hypothetical protein